MARASRGARTRARAETARRVAGARPGRVRGTGGPRPWRGPRSLLPPPARERRPRCRRGSAPGAPRLVVHSSVRSAESIARAASRSSPSSAAIGGRLGDQLVRGTATSPQETNAAASCGSSSIRSRRVAREERVRPTQQRRPRPTMSSRSNAAVPARPRCSAARAASRSTRGAVLAGLAPCAHGLVEVVAGGEIDVAATLDRAPGEPLVQLGPPPLGQAAVRDVPDQAVAERPAGAAGIVGLARPDELAADERQQGRRRDPPRRAPRPPPS